MATPKRLYRDSVALLTDLYQLTMAYGFWKAGATDKEAVSNFFFRENPFQGGFTILCGLSALIECLDDFRFDTGDIQYLSTLRGNNQEPLFEREFLEHLRSLRFACDIDAIPEGAVVFPHEPLVRVQGPIVQCQLLESFLLNVMNFQTLIATKAARICQAAKDEPVLEFGLRRAQGVDGALAASRAAYVGGCEGTSNVLAGKLFGIPVRGTHAHSWVMSFDEELEAFLAFAKAMPNNCILLVDTYDTLEGVRKAVEVGKTLRERGHKLAGIRLDSGDLAYLSIEARKILDAGGLSDAVIFASNDLDEHIIASLKDQGATIASWGVGTRLVTGHGQSALGGVYKLTALRRAGGPWEYKLKLSEQTQKISTPGILQVRRYFSDEGFIADAIYDLQLGIEESCTLVHPLDFTRRKRIPKDTRYADLQVPIYRDGRRIYTPPSLPEIREHARNQLDRLHRGIRRFVNPHVYPVGLERRLHDLKTKLILQARSQSG
ncbi:MAG: nicotinate phosphoribosyltransferase [Acidobacteria bacterium]|nr:nicotinate phosphoribosyltransferase [Acidobacteriota bacterium]